MTSRGEQGAPLERAVVTLAVGKPFYVSLAVNLARSFLWWHRRSDIGFAIATDQAHLLPPDLHDVRVIPLTPGQFGSGFTPKLYLDQFAPAERTLFVDSDCLCVSSLEPVFERFASRSVAVAGGTMSAGEWFGDVQAVCRRFGLPHLVKFNGGLYYLERGAQSTAVYETARQLEPEYDRIGLVRLRGKPNEELLMAISMAMHAQSPVPDDGTIMADPQAFPGPIVIDVLRGGAHLQNPSAPHATHRTWNQLSEARPVIVHFLDDWTLRHPYVREEFRLALVLGRHWPMWAANVAAALLKSGPAKLTHGIKELLRPVYRRLFGTRGVKISPRA